MKDEHEDKQVGLFKSTSVVCSPVDELKGICARYAGKGEVNRAGILMNEYIYGHVQQ